MHCKEKHKKAALAAGYAGMESFIAHVIDDSTEIIPLGKDDLGRDSEFLVSRVEGARLQDSTVIEWNRARGYYTLKSAYSSTTNYPNNKKSLSPGSNPVAPAQIPAPIPSDASERTLGDGVRQHYGDSDSGINVAPPKKPVNTLPPPPTQDVLFAGR